MKVSVKRIFRSDTAHDILSAILIAQRLPEGENYLAFSTDYSDKSSEMSDCMNYVAHLYEWKKVFDISDLPINNFWQNNTKGRFSRIKSAVESAKMLKKRFSDDLIGQIDEIYINCLHHSDVQIFCGLFPKAKINFYPHGFDSLHQNEIQYYQKHITNDEKKSLKRIVADTGKQILFGKDSITPNFFKIETVYTFNEKFPNLENQTDLSEVLNYENVRDLYENLQSNVKSYFEDLRTKCSQETLLLLLYVSDYYPTYPADLELDGYIKLINRIEKKKKFKTVLIKPHPLNKPEWLLKVKKYLETNLPEKQFVFIEKYRYLPIEFIASAFDFTICTGLGSSSIRTIQKIYKVPTYFTGDLLTRLFYNHPYHLKASEVWAEDMRKNVLEV